MAFPITWIVHDPHESDRVNRILAALKQGESRDELGLGGVRDSLADLLFPGTSTIQTRLRYFLIVAWCYRSIEIKGTRAPRFARKVEQLERHLIGQLKDQDGAFGRVAGDKLKRLPSSVYWSGLEQWGIRRVSVSQSQYHRNIDQFLAAAKRKHKTEEGEEVLIAPNGIWDPHLPDIPADFETSLDFALTSEEADFLTKRIEASAAGSLLAWLTVRPEKAPDVSGARFPWQLPCFAELPAELRTTLHHAWLLSLVTHGAAQLYNLMLAESSDDDFGQQVAATRKADLKKWRQELKPHLESIDSWDHGLLQQICAQVPGHRISSRTWTFLKTWRERVVASNGKVWKDPVACELVRAREQQLKRRSGRSRFTNARLRAQWKGAAGLGRLDFRWAPTKRLLADLYEARDTP